MRLALFFLVALGTAPHLFAQSTLRAGETVELRIAGVPTDEIPQFGGAYQIDDSGLLNLPFIGGVKAAGFAASQVQTAIESKLKAEGIYTHPTITVLIPSAGRFVSVGGSVRSPGRVVYTPDLTLMSAIEAAGGKNDFAKDIAFLTHAGERKQFSLKKIRKDPKTDPPVVPGDQINVPASLF